MVQHKTALDIKILGTFNVDTGFTSKKVGLIEEPVYSLGSKVPEWTNPIRPIPRISALRHFELAWIL
jgi:hypothetical protein